jgi:DeoR/GlpR family transcriptional regulator of sugar metabolism
VLADSSKLAGGFAHHIKSAERIHILITDRNAPPKIRHPPQKGLDVRLV